MQQKKPSIKNKYPSNKKKRPRSVIHVTIGLPQKIHSITNKSYLTSSNERKVSVTPNHQHAHSISVTKLQRVPRSSSESTKAYTSTCDNSIKISLSQTNESTKTSHWSYHPDTIISDYSQNMNNSSDRKGITNDYHHKLKCNKKKKCSRQCFIVTFIVIFVLLLIIAAILLALLIKLNSKKTIITPSNQPVLRWNKTGITVAGITGVPGSTSYQLNQPLDVVLDYANHFYVADAFNGRVQKFSFGSLIGQTVAGNGTSGISQYQLGGPSRVIIDPNGDFYVTNTYRQQIILWRNGAISGQAIAGVAYSAGNASNQLYTPYGIALNPASGILYISDYNNHRIMSYASGVHNGTLVFGGTGPGIMNTQLYYPVGLQFDAVSNSLIIANHGVNNIVRYVLGANTWSPILGNMSGFSGSTSTTFSGLIEARLDPMGNFYVADRDNHRIQFFYINQLNGSTIAGISGVSGNNNNTLNSPRSVAVDSQLNVYVADYGNHRIQKFLRY